MSQSQSHPTDFDQAVAKLEEAITGPDGPNRIEFELLDGGGVKWNLWHDSRRLYSATGHATDIAGFLAASRMLLEMGADAMKQPPPSLDAFSENHGK